MPSSSRPVNPYQSPPQTLATNPREIDRNLIDRKLLEAYQNHRHNAPSLLGYIGKMLPSWLLILVLCSGAASLLYFFVGRFEWSLATGAGVAAFTIGMFVGSCARDIGWIRRVVRNWPMLAQIIDWNEVERLLAADDKVSPAADAHPTDS